VPAALVTAWSATALPPLGIALPLAGACLLLALGRVLPRVAVEALAAAVVAGVAVLMGVLVAVTATGRVVSWAGGWRPVDGVSVGIVLVADPFGAGLALLIALLTLAALLYGWRYFTHAEAHLPVLLLLFLAGMTGFALTGDLFDMFVFFELMGAVAYALTGYKIEEPESVQGAFNFGVINSLGGYLCLAGIGLLYARTGQLGLAQLGAALSGHRADLLVLVAFTLVATGWLVKAAAVPFHFWLADAHAVAPTPVCVLFSGVMAPLGVYGVARVYWVTLSGAESAPQVQRALLVLGGLTAVVGAVMCVTQRHLKRLLAYSTIAHIGLFLLGVAALDPTGLAGSALYLAGHAGIKGALFLMTGVLLTRHGSVDEITLYGRGRASRLLGGLYLLAALALAGLPPFGVALGKAISEQALAAGWATALFTVVSAVTGAATLRAGLRVFFAVGPPPADHHPDDVTTGEREEREGEPAPRRTPPTMLAAVLVLLALGLVTGLPQVAAAAGRAAERFVDRSGYLQQALYGAGAPAVPTPHGVAWTALGTGLGLGSAALAACLALLALYAARLPRTLRVAGARMAPATHALHRLHSGHIGDYVAWLLVGAVALGVLLALPGSAAGALGVTP
jgi:multicomponent Na+:H+ antiporter subunit D